MKMKKLLSLLLALIITAALFAGCGGGGTSAETTAASSSGTAATTEPDKETSVGSEDQSIDGSVPESVSFDDEPNLTEPVKCVMVYAAYSEMFFNNTNETMCPGLLRITYNAQNGSINEYQLAFYDKYADTMDDIYAKLAGPEGTYVNCVTNVRYEGKYILADGVKGYINLSGLEVGGSYDNLLEECKNDEYAKEYSENAYFSWDLSKGVYFYDDVRELDLSVLEKEFSWNEGKDLSELSSLLAYNEFRFTADDGSDQILEIRIADDNMCGLMLFSNYLSPMGTDDYRIDGNTLYVMSDCCRLDDVYYSYIARLDFNGKSLTASFRLYSEDEDLTLDNYTEKTELRNFVLDCAAD